VSSWSHIASAAAAFRKESGQSDPDASLRGRAGWGLNSAAGVRVSAETAMQHTMAMTCVTVVSEPLGKQPNWLVRRLGNGGSVVVRDHSLPALLQKPNARRTRLEVIKMMQVSIAQCCTSC
jgi:phage portal protein BeeE